MNPALGCPFIAELENLGCPLLPALDLPLGLEGKCVLLNGRLKHGNSLSFHGNYLPRQFEIQWCLSSTLEIPQVRPLGVFRLLLWLQNHLGSLSNIRPRARLRTCDSVSWREVWTSL